jgi:hypothetical protein
MTLPESLAHSRVMQSLSKHDAAGIVGPFPCHAEPVEARLRRNRWPIPVSCRACRSMTLPESLAAFPCHAEPVEA